MIKPAVFADHEALARHAAASLVDALSQKPDVLLCLAAGSTPRRTYELLAERQRADPGLFERMRIIKLDEWGGLPMDDAATCERFLRESLVDQFAMGNRYFAFESNPADPLAECRRVANWLAQNGPIDCCVLGLGVNGHVGFNEPASALQSHAHVATLSDTSLQHWMLHKTNRRPTFGITLGMVDLLHSKKVLLLVSGEGKRQPLRRLLDGPIATGFPASLLLLHPNLTLVADGAAID